jgi:hypothetical protein
MRTALVTRLAKFALQCMLMPQAWEIHALTLQGG